MVDDMLSILLYCTDLCFCDDLKLPGSVYIPLIKSLLDVRKTTSNCSALSNPDVLVFPVRHANFGRDP